MLTLFLSPLECCVASLAIYKTSRRMRIKERKERNIAWLQVVASVQVRFVFFLRFFSCNGREECAYIIIKLPSQSGNLKERVTMCNLNDHAKPVPCKSTGGDRESREILLFTGQVVDQIDLRG